jgi:hypothetical protein
MSETSDNDVGVLTKLLTFLQEHGDQHYNNVDLSHPCPAILEQLKPKLPRYMDKYIPIEEKNVNIECSKLVQQYLHITAQQSPSSLAPLPFTIPFSNPPFPHALYFSFCWARSPSLGDYNPPVFVEWRAVQSGPSRDNPSGDASNPVPPEQASRAREVPSYSGEDNRHSPVQRQDPLRLRYQGLLCSVR